MTTKVLQKKGLFLVPFLFYLSLFLIFEPSQASDLEVLANSKEWKKHLRYERTILTPWWQDSAVRDDSFFLSKNGKDDPLAELKANIEAFKQPIDSLKNPNHHALCRFPARYKWLKKKIGLKDITSDLKKCADYQRWNESGQISSISMYFATGYFGNPASFFGHPLLKFNRKGGQSQFIDTSLNYGAMTPEHENPIFYVLKGLFGGYTASFTRHDFFYHNHNYSETEMRDLWEYRLDLDPEEVQFIVDRTWELLGRNHPYIFLTDNCAYRMAELLEEVFKKPMIFRNRLYVIPIDFFDNLAKGKRDNGRPFVSEINVVPSRYTRLLKTFNKLNDEEKSLVQSTIKNNGIIDQAALKKQSNVGQSRALETLINYYSFQKLKDKENKEIEAKRVAMIRERFKINEKSGFQSMSFEDIPPPHKTVNSFGLGFTHAYGDLLGNFQEFTVRPALYDELNPSVGRPDNTSLEVFKTQIRLHDSDLTLRGMELFRVSTIDSSKVRLPETGNMSWKIRMGLRSQSMTCRNCLVTFAEGGVGASWTLWQGAVLYGLVKAGLQNNRNNQGTLYGLPEVGVYIRLLENWKLGAMYEYEKFLNSLESEFDVWTLESRFGSSKWWDIRLKYQKRDEEQILLTFWLYL